LTGEWEYRRDVRIHGTSTSQEGIRRVGMFTLRDAQTTATETKWHASTEDAVGPDCGPSIARMVFVKTVVLPACTVL